MFPITILAQEKAGFSVSPPSFEINALPGDTIKNTIKIENLSPFSLKIAVKPQNFVAYGEGGQVSLTDEGNTFSISKWIELSNETFTIAPNDFYLASFKINIPRNAEPGSHYGAVVFSTVTDQKTNGSGASLAQEIGSLILIKLPGDVFENAKLKSFQPTQSIFKDPKIALNALIENTGNVHVKPYGYISITNIFGQKVASIEVKGKNILPGSKRVFNEEFDFKKIGFFKAEINLLYSGGGKILKSETNFTALNLQASKKYLMIIGGLLIFYVLFFKRVNRALKIILTGK
jgi:hypothetical protein